MKLHAVALDPIPGQSSAVWPNYPEANHYAAEKLGWDLSEFDVYRLRVEYPVFGSVVQMQFAIE